ncbi:MAG: hypothetical protein KDC07_05245 [Chitinophagaceae bacterium]|nr:hypothetical protein [Chitinophagaceae bacterium]
MRLKVLLTGKDRFDHEADAELLRERGFLVYRCKETSVNDMIEELHPDVLIINPIDEEQSSTNLYNRLLDNIKYAKLPLIYTLLEDDVYLVNRKRTSARGKRNFIVDNIIDGIRTALGGNRKTLNNYNLGLAS